MKYKEDEEVLKINISSDTLQTWRQQLNEMENLNNLANINYI